MPTKTIHSQTILHYPESKKLMKTYNFTAPNFMINKTYKIYQQNDKVKILVSSPFLGNWDFEISEMTYDQVSYALNSYCAGALVQDCFSNLPPILRENFITPPSLWENMDG